MVAVHMVPDLQGMALRMRMVLDLQGKHLQKRMEVDLAGSHRRSLEVEGLWVSKRSSE
jgi:hypothetical protein